MLEELSISAIADDCQGVIRVNVDSGNGNYRYRMDNGAWQELFPESPTSYIFRNLSPGNHAVSVMDARGCQKTISPVVLGSAEFSLDIGNGLQTGAFWTMLDTGLDSPEYTITWYFNGNLIESETEGNLLVFENGRYEVQVIDVEGCTGQGVITINSLRIIAPMDLESCVYLGDNRYVFDLSKNNEESMGLNGARYEQAWNIWHCNREPIVLILFLWTRVEAIVTK